MKYLFLVVWALLDLFLFWLACTVVCSQQDVRRRSLCKRWLVRWRRCHRRVIVWWRERFL